MYNILGEGAGGAKIFEWVDMTIEQSLFGRAEDEEITKKYNDKRKSVILFKKYDEKNGLRAHKVKELKEFVDKIFIKVGIFND